MLQINKHTFEVWYCGVGNPQCPPLHRCSVMLMCHETWNDRMKQLCFSTSIYRKKNFTVLCIINGTDWHLESGRLTPSKQSLIAVSASVPLPSLFQSVILNLLPRNGYPPFPPPAPPGVITYNINDVVTRNRNKPKDPITTVPKRYVFIVLTYLGLQSTENSLRTRNTHILQQGQA